MTTDCLTFSHSNMRHLVYLAFVLVLPSCGGQLYKTFQPSAGAGVAVYTDSLNNGQLFMLRIAEQYDKIQSLEVMHGDSTIIQEEVPVKVYRNVSDTGFRFLPDDSLPGKPYDVYLHDVVGTNFIFLSNLGGNTGRAYVMSALRVFPTPLKPSVRLKKREAGLKYKSSRLGMLRNEKNASRIQRRLGRVNEDLVRVRAEMRELETSMRSAFIRRKMCDNDSLDWAMIDQVWVGQWWKMNSKNHIEIHVPIEGPYGRNWFEMSVNIDTNGILHVDSISNPTADRLTTQAMPSKTKISVGDCISVSGASEGLAYFPDERMTVITRYERKRFRINYAKRARPMGSDKVEAIEVVEMRKKHHVNLVAGGGKFLKKSRVRVL